MAQQCLKSLPLFSYNNFTYHTFCHFPWRVTCYWNDLLKRKFHNFLKIISRNFLTTDWTIKSFIINCKKLLTTFIISLSAIGRISLYTVYPSKCTHIRHTSRSSTKVNQPLLKTARAFFNFFFVFFFFFLIECVRLLERRRRKQFVRDMTANTRAF